MQPPEIEPASSPSMVQASIEPGGRGEEPQVLRMVESQTGLPSPSQPATREMMFC